MIYAAPNGAILASLPRGLFHWILGKKLQDGWGNPVRRISQQTLSVSDSFSQCEKKTFQLNANRPLSNSPSFTANKLECFWVFPRGGCTVRYKLNKLKHVPRGGSPNTDGKGLEPVPWTEGGPPPPPWTGRQDWKYYLRWRIVKTKIGRVFRPKGTWMCTISYL